MGVNPIQAVPARQYKGMRYVPIFDGEWDSTKDYEPLVIVSHLGNSYTSKTYVPAGTEISDETYWALTGNYNAQVEAYRQEVGDYAEQVDDLIENLGDNENLLTVDNSVIGAINENFINSKFVGARYGSKIDSAPSGQFVISYNGFLYGAGEPYDGEHFYIVKFNDDMEELRTYTFDRNAHPNAMFVIDSYLYVVDTRNYVIYKIDTNSFTITDTFDLDANYGSGCVVGDYVYLNEGLRVDIYTKEFILHHTIELEEFNRNVDTTVQTIFVFDGYIYKLINRPNALVVWDMDGKLIAIKEMGVGSGFYPYGEIENLFIHNGHIMFNGVLFNSTFSSVAITQLFYCNLNEPIVSDARYGDPTPQTSRQLYVNNTLETPVKNAIGSIDLPFSNLYEAGCVYNYLYSLHQYFHSLHVTGVYTNDSLVLENCTFYIATKIATFGSITLLNCDAILNTQSISTIHVRGGSIHLTRCTIGTLDVKDATISFGGSKITTAITMSYVTVADRDVTTTDVTGDNVAIDHLYIRDIYSGNSFSAFTQKYLFDVWSNKTANCDFTFLISNKVRFHAYASIITSEKTAINNNESVTKYLSAICNYNGTTVIFSADVTINKSGYSISNVSWTDLSGTSVTVSGTLLNDVVFNHPLNI